MSEKNTKTKVLMVVGYGENCREETFHLYHGLLRVESVARVHIKDLRADPKMLRGFNILELLGGFVDGDHIRSGIIQALRLSRGELGEEVRRFVREGKLVSGYCNGFQVLTQMGLLPGLDGNYADHSLTLAPNVSGKYEDRWVMLAADPNSPCVFTRGIRSLELPVRHGEGRLVAKEGVLARMTDGGQIALRYVNEAGIPTMRYPLNPNGSTHSIAGVCDPTGRVFGMMPHREAYLYPENHPRWTRQAVQGDLPLEGLGVQFARNAVEFVEERL